MTGTVAAATLSAAVARRLRPALARPALWVAGLATPLLFDGYLVIAHTLGAALAAAAVVLGLRLLDNRGRTAVTTVGIGACAAGAVLLRTEAVLWGVALAAALAVLAARRRSRPLVGAATLALVATAAARLGEHLWVTRIVGQPVAPLRDAPRAGAGLLAGRVGSVELTWLAPGYGWSPGAALALVVMAGAVVVGAVVARRLPGKRRLMVALAVTASAAALAAVAIAPTNLVPGLLVTCPVALAGLVAARRSTLVQPAARLALTAFALFAVAVAATQYAGGGSVEWGGRYFALGLPVLVPVVLEALAGAGQRLDRRTARTAAGALAVCSLAVAAMGVTSLAAIHRVTARLTATADRAGQQVDPTGRPVMVATAPSAPRLAWATFDRQRWLIARPVDLAALVGRLRAAGLTDVVLVTRDLATDLTAAGPRVEVVPVPGPDVGSRWRVVVLHLRP
jgi:hypothetical protein